jgi:hypothetical protein
MRKGLASAMVACALLVGGAQAVHAEELRVTNGGLIFDFEGDTYLFMGSGFSIQSDPFANLGLVIDRQTAPTCTFCNAGDTVDLSFHTPGEVNLGTGSATIGGTSYSDIALRGVLDFAVTPVAFPSSSDLFVDIKAPLSFTGTIRGLSGGNEVFALDLFGSGTARAPYFFWDAMNAYVSDMGRVTYDFDANSTATPEPTSLLLLAPGLAAGALARRRRRSRG